MKITKIFRTETSHIVANTFSDRCRKSYHGHSYVIEVSLESSQLDNAGMVLDFGLLKGPVRDFIDSFDHAHMINKFNKDEVDFFTKHNDRWIKLPFNPSAEMMALMFLAYVKRLINQHNLNNGEGRLYVTEVTVHETVTGRATASMEDYERLWKPEWNLEFSDGIKKDWSPELVKMLNDPGYVLNIPMPEQTVCMK